MKSWKTSLFGALAACAAGLEASGDDTFKTIGRILGALSLAAMGFFARDNSVSSEKAGVHDSSHP